jgi:hypothetical protein
MNVFLLLVGVADKPILLFLVCASRGLLAPCGCHCGFVWLSALPHLRACVVVSCDGQSSYLLSVCVAESMRRGDELAVLYSVLR